MCSYIFIITQQSILSTVLFTAFFSFTVERVLVLRYNCDISLYKCTRSLTIFYMDIWVVFDLVLCKQVCGGSPSVDVIALLCRIHNSINSC